MNGHRIHDHAAFRFLDLVHLDGLTLDAHVPVYEADAALARHADGRVGFGDRIHGRTDNRDIESEILCQLGAGVAVLGQDIGIVGYQQHIIERIGFVRGDFAH